jgi:hypothetical protein
MFQHRCTTRAFTLCVLIDAASLYIPLSIQQTTGPGNTDKTQFIKDGRSLSCNFFYITQIPLNGSQTGVLTNEFWMSSNSASDHSKQVRSCEIFLTANHNELASEDVLSARNRDQITSSCDYCNEPFASIIYSEFTV